jgi:hypothetical protein
MSEQYKPLQEPSAREQLMQATGKSYKEVYEMSNADISDQLATIKNEHGADIADIVTIGKSGNTVHRPDGKFISKYELAQIQANQDVIRENIGKQTASNVEEAHADVTEIIATPDNTETETGTEKISRLWRMKLGIYNSAMKLYDFVASGTARSQERYKGLKGETKERWGQKKYATAIALGGAAAFAGLDLNAKLAIANKVAYTTGAALDLPDVIQDFVDNVKSEIPDELSYNRTENHQKDRMSTEGLFDGETRGMKATDTHALQKIENNPSLLASLMEINESGTKDKNFSLQEVNQDTHDFTVSGKNGQYSSEGQESVEKLRDAWGEKPGKLMSDSEVRKLQSRYTLINHGVDEGGFESARDDKMYSAGEFDYRPDLGDKIYRKELENGHVVFMKVNEQDPTRDCLNILTLVEKSHSQPSSTISTPEDTPTNNKPGAEGKIDEPQPQDEGKLGDPEGQLPPEKTETGKQPTTPTTTKNPEQPPHLQPKDPSKDINANPELNPQVQVGDDRVPAGPQETAPGSRPPETYTPPAQPVETPTTPRTEVPPVESNPSTGQNANGPTGINNAPKNPTTGAPEQQNPGSI